MSILLGMLLQFVRVQRANFTFPSTDVLLFDMADLYGGDLNCPVFQSRHECELFQMCLSTMGSTFAGDIPYWELVARLW